MVDPRLVIAALDEAHDLVRDHWGSSNVDVSWEDAGGAVCASVGICGVCCTADLDVQDAAHVALLRGAGIEVPSDRDEMYAAVYRFNDSQHTRATVLAAFSRAIEIVQGELADRIMATPNADATLAVMAACDRAGEVIAQGIVSEHPLMDEREVALLASSELFYAAQDTAKTCAASEAVPS